jgi:hypothetical protein
MGTNWGNLDAARAALSDPKTPTGELLAICLALPSLCAEAALHPSADGDLLSWLSRHEDPIVAAMAQARRRRSAFCAARCWASSRWARRSRSRWLFVFAMTAHATRRH